MDIAEGKKIRARHTPDVVAIPIADELVLFDTLTGALHALDARAAVLWQCFDGTSTTGEIAADVAAAFGIDVASATADVCALVDVLSTLGVLQTAWVEMDHSREVGGDVGVETLENPPDP